MTDNLFIETVNGHKQNKTPIWMMRQAGRYLAEYRAVRATQKDFISFCLNPEQASAVTLQPIARYGFDAAIIFSDILMVPWALERNVRFQPNIGPLLDPLDKPSVISDDLVDSLSEPQTALIGFAGAPWTIITYMAEGGSSRDFAKARGWAWQYPKEMDGLLDSLIESTTAFLSLQAEAGADALMLFDSWASAVPAAQRHWLVIEPARKIVTGLREKGHFQPIIGFPKGIGEGLIAYVEHSSVNAVGLDHGVDPVWVDQNLPKNFPVQGNLDPLSLLQAGPDMFKDIDHILDAFASRPHIFNLGHGITPPTPIENVQLMLDHVRQRHH
ncbi:MAG: uroporphyrinogen decarboxylase [Alphaproteobacteria bacterium]|nr:uroporphyrinogen decarboxylase [Alphaproteobacteria bacterium]